MAAIGKSLRGLALAAVAAILWTGTAEAATCYISEFANGISAVGTTQPQVPPQPAIADQTVALSGTTAQSAAFNAKTHVVSVICDEGASILFGAAPVATTSNLLMQQGVAARFGVVPGQIMAAIANAAGNTATGSGGGAVTIADGADVTQGSIADAAVASGAAGTVNAHLRTISGQLPATLGQKTMATSLPVVIASDQSAVPVSLPASSLIIGNVRIDQTTPGTTNGVALVGVNGATALAGNGVAGPGSPRVTIASDNTPFHIIQDSGSTTVVTGNVTVVQPTGTNLHAVLDTTSTTAVTQATASNLNATVVGTGTFAVQAAATQSGTWTVQPGNTANTTPWLVTGSGTAGSAAAGVQTVQGIASMTPILVQGTGTAGTPATSVLTVQGTASMTAVQVGGAVADAATASGNPVPVGGIYNSALPLYTTGQRTQAQSGSRGSLNATLFVQDSTNPLTLGASSSDTLSSVASSFILETNSLTRLWNGVSFSRAAQAADATNSTGIGIAAAGILGQLDDTSPNTITENNFGNVRISTDRSLNVAPVPYTSAMVPETASSGLVSNASTVATLAAAAGKTTYITGFQCSGGGATAATAVSISVAGVITGTMTYVDGVQLATALNGVSTLSIQFNPPVPASATNTQIVVTQNAAGTGGTSAVCNAQGFQL